LYQDLDSVSPDGMPYLHANVSKNHTVPSVHGGALFADNVNKKIYLFGGEYFGEPPTTSFGVYYYDVINDFWIQLGQPQQPVRSVSYGAAATVSERGEGYYLGGWQSNASVLGWAGPPAATANLTRYKMDENVFEVMPGPDAAPRAEGVLLYLPASDGGLLVYFGGVVDAGQNGTAGPQPLDTIFLYDILSSKWYTQRASGDVPGPRRRFCAGVAWAQNQSSYNMWAERDEHVAAAGTNSPQIPLRRRLLPALDSRI
jgi:hypothetical protein